MCYRFAEILPAERADVTQTVRPKPLRIRDQFLCHRHPATNNLLSALMIRINERFSWSASGRERVDDDSGGTFGTLP